MAAEVTIKSLSVSSYAESKDVVGAFLTGDLEFEITAGSRKIEFAVKFQNTPSPNQAVQAGLKELEGFSQDLQAAVRVAQARYRYGP